MKRREAILGIGCTFTSAAISGSVLGVLFSCTKQQENRIPEFFAKQEVLVIEALVDVIIPKNETPGSLDLNVVQFIERMIRYTETGDVQEQLKSGIHAFIVLLEKTYNKKMTFIISSEVQGVFKKYCSISKLNQERLFQQLEKPLSEIPEIYKSQYLISLFITKIRYFTLLGFFTSQEIMEGYEDFNPNLGYYQGCLNV